MHCTAAKEKIKKTISLTLMCCALPKPGGDAISEAKTSSWVDPRRTSTDSYVQRLGSFAVFSPFPPELTPHAHPRPTQILPLTSPSSIIMPTLQSIGVHPQLRERLLALEPAIETPQALLSRDPSSLAQTLRVPLVQVDKVRAAVADAIVAKAPHGKRALHVTATVTNEESHRPLVVGAVTALEICRYQEYLHGGAPAGISTASRRCDELLALPREFKSSSNGGLPFGYVTQVSGPPASGKTQLALKLAAQHAANSGKVYFLASGFGHGTLLPLVRRLQHFCNESNFQKVVQNVTFTTVCSGYEALAALEQVGDRKRVLVIFDSASGCLSGDLYASGDGDVGLMLAQKVAYTLRRVARHNGAAVLVTQGTVSGDGSGVVKAAMGQAWYVADIALWFQIVQQDSRIEGLDGTVRTGKRIRATLEHHSAKASQSNVVRTAELLITSSGIEDIDEQPEVMYQG